MVYNDKKHGNGKLTSIESELVEKYYKKFTVGWKVKIC